jgi:hypothetical protein
MKLQNPLSLCVIVSAVIFTATPQMKAADPTDQCPRFQLNPLDAYKNGMKYSFLTPGSGNPKTDILYFGLLGLLAAAECTTAIAKRQTNLEHRRQQKGRSEGD